MGGGDNYISLGSDKKRKHHKDHRKEGKNGDNRSSKYAEGSEKKKQSGGDTTIDQEARSSKLRKRICTYLEENKDKQFIDIEDMTKTLHNRYPDYNRKKYKIFREICEKGFDYLQESAANPQAAPVFDLSESSSDESQKSKAKKKKDEGATSTSKAAAVSSSPLQTAGAAVKTESTTKPTENDVTASNGSAVVDLTSEDKDSVSELPQLSSSALLKSTQKSSRVSSPLTVGGSARKSLAGSLSARKRSTAEFGVTMSDITFAQLGGLEKTLVKICKSLIHLKHPEVYEHIGVTPARGILLHGPPGCGKTLLANAIAGELKLPILKLAATEIVSGISGESESRLRELFESAMAAAPCILFIDEIDAITQRRDQSNKGMESRIVGQLLACMDDLNSKGTEKEGQVVVIGATNRPDVLDPALRRAGRFESEIAIGIPDERARRSILDVMSRGLNISPTFDMQTLARMTPGYVGADLAALLREAAISAVNRILNQLKPNPDLSESLQLTDLVNWLSDETSVPDATLSSVQIDMADFEKALKSVQPSSMREGFATVPNVTWNDIGALTDIREELEVSILAPVNYPELTATLGLEAPTGILLCGPPGCGKTLLAKAVANQAGINFISVKGPELLNMYVGESERAVRQVFQRAKNSAPCVIFFDELDSLAPRRSGSGDSSGASRVVNQLLTEMDGVEGRKGVYIMAATNRLDIIDPAVLRPGRLQKILHVDIPSPDDRVSILRAITKHKPLLASDVNFLHLAHDQRCDGFSGADLSALVTEASMAAFKEHIIAERLSGITGLAAAAASKGEVRVCLRHFEEAFTKVRPSVLGKDKSHYESLKRRYQLQDSTTTPTAAVAAVLPPPDVKRIKPDAEVQDTHGMVETPHGQQESSTMETETSAVDALSNETSSAVPKKNTRFLEQMEVRVNDGSSLLNIAGCEGVVTSLISPNSCLLQMRSGSTVTVPISDLEPFIPEPNDLAKILVDSESEETVHVIDYYGSAGFDAGEEENATVKFQNGDIRIFPLDQLCKVSQ